jgi:hypothetical protein
VRQTPVVPQRRRLRLFLVRPLHRSLPPIRGATTRSVLYHVLPSPHASWWRAPLFCWANCRGHRSPNGRETGEHGKVDCLGEAPSPTGEYDTEITSKNVACRRRIATWPPPRYGTIPQSYEPKRSPPCGTSVRDLRAGPPCGTSVRGARIGGSRPPAARDAHAVEERLARQGDEPYLITRHGRAVLSAPVREPLRRVSGSRWGA